MPSARRPSLGTYPENALHSEVIFRCGGLPVALSSGLLAQGIELAVAGLGGIWVAGEGGDREVALLILRASVARTIPVLATGRAAPLLNRLLGGTERALAAHERPEHVQLRPVDQPHHPVEVEEGTVLAECLESGQLMINSVSEMVMDRLGEGLRVGARAYDGAVEAVELPRPRFVVGVQWEPQRLLRSMPIHRALFEALVTASRRAPDSRSE